MKWLMAEKKRLMSYGKKKSNGEGKENKEEDNGQKKRGRRRNRQMVPTKELWWGRRVIEPSESCLKLPLLPPLPDMIFWFSLKVFASFS